MVRRIVWIFSFLIIMFCTTSCTDPEKPTEASQSSSEQEIADEAVKSIILIFNGARQYRQDYSEDPLDVSELDTLEYSVIDEQTRNHWDFSLIGRNPITGIVAVSKTEMPYGEGKIVSFSLQTGKFSGWFSDDPKSESEFAGEAQRAIPAFYNALNMYSRDFGENPEGGVDDLFRLEYLRVVEWVLNDWEFSFEGDDTLTAINAISTPVMDYGAGKLITFNLQTGRYSGWLSNNVKTEKDFSFEAQLSISNLHNALNLYRQDYGGSPFVSVKELLEIGYFHSDEWVLNEWEFSFGGTDSISGISAISTAQMKFGEGKTIHLDFSTWEYSGWLFNDESIELLVSVYIQYVQGARASDQ